MEPMLDIAELRERATGVRVFKTLPCDDDYIILLEPLRGIADEVVGKYPPTENDRRSCVDGLCAGVQRHFHGCRLARRASGRVDVGGLHDDRGSRYW